MTQLNNTKLLYIITDTFGELFDCWYFVSGVFSDVTILIPETRFSVVDKKQDEMFLFGDKFPVYSYSQKEEVVKYIDDVQPELVFLASGYTVQTPKLRFYLDYLHEKSIKYLTTDPLLNVLGDEIKNSYSSDDLSKNENRLLSYFMENKSLLADVGHISSIPVKGNLSYYNPDILIKNQDRQFFMDNIKKRCPSYDPRKELWLFVISSEDYDIQCKTYGKEQFHEMLYQRLQESSFSDKNVVLIAPEACTDYFLNNQYVFAEAVFIFSFCKFSLYISFLYEAEYVFYWNTLSASILIRVLNRLPFVMLSKKGHMGHFFSPLDKALQEVINVDVPVLSIEESITGEELDNYLAKEEVWEDSFVPECEKLMSPLDVIAKL